MFESAGLMLYRFYEAGGQYDRAARVIERLLARAREKGDVYDIAMLTNNLGYEYLLVGHWPTAEQHFQDALARFKQIDARTDILNCHANILECRFSRLRPEKWDALLPMLKTINRALVNSSDWRARKTLRLLARYAQHRGHMRAARGWIRRAIAAAKYQPTRLREWDEAYLERLEALR